VPTIRSIPLLLCVSVAQRPPPPARPAPDQLYVPKEHSGLGVAGCLVAAFAHLLGGAGRSVDKAALADILTHAGGAVAKGRVPPPPDVEVGAV